jgi:hypothetical protein
MQSQLLSIHTVMKYLVINPLFKNGEKSVLINYRPIFLLTDL